MSILAFQMPEKVVMEKADDFKGQFTFKPLEKGYGVTIGNALRRILLSSLEGYAVTGIKVPGVLHEFSTLTGMVEDVSELILNIKMIRFKRVEDSLDHKIHLQVTDKKVITAGDLANFTNSFEVLNKDLVLCHLDEAVNFELELFVEKGRGYVSAEENKQADQTFDYIPIDAIFTPIKNVKFGVENTRVEQKTDFEKLVIEVETDGSIHPELALKEASNILIKHFMLFSDKNMVLETSTDGEEEKMDEEFLHMRKLLKTSLSELDLSVRAYNCLKAADIKTLGDLAQLEISDMMKFRNFGKKSLNELEKLIADKMLTFGMDVSKYRLDED